MLSGYAKKGAISLIVMYQGPGTRVTVMQLIRTRMFTYSQQRILRITLMTSHIQLQSKLQPVNELLLVLVNSVA